MGKNVDVGLVPPPASTLGCCRMGKNVDVGLVPPPAEVTTLPVLSIAKPVVPVDGAIISGLKN